MFCILRLCDFGCVVGNVVSPRRTQVVGNRGIVCRRFASPALTFKPMQSVRLRLAKQVNRSRTKKQNKNKHEGDVSAFVYFFFVPCPEATTERCSHGVRRSVDGLLRCGEE